MSGNIDPRAEFGALIQQLEHIVSQSFRDVRRTRDHKEKALHRKVALDAIRELATLYQDVGLVAPKDFVTPIEDVDRKVERIPSGLELQKWFDGIVVHDGELISDAEKALLFGDQAAAEAADRRARNRTDSEG